MSNPCDQLESYGEATSSVFGIGLTSLVASLAAAASLILSAEQVICNETANAQSILIAPPENVVVSSAATTSQLLDRLVANNTLTNSAVAQSVATVSYSALVQESANAQSMLFATKESDCTSNGAATSTVLSGATRAPFWVLESGTARSILTMNNPDNSVQSSAVAVSTGQTSVHAAILLTTNAAASTFILDSYTPRLDAEAQGVATSAVLDRVDAYTILSEYAQAVSSLPVPPSDQAWAANLETHAMWRYKDFAPRWLASIKGAVIALTDAGLCEAAPADNVNWYIETGWSELGDQHKKRLTYTYVGGEYPADTKLEVAVDMVPAYYGYALLGKRATIGKGLNARYWRFRVSGTGAGSLLDIRTDVAISTRRI